MAKLLNELKQKFTSEVKESNIAYDWDAGYCYSYIDHPLVQTDHDLNEEDSTEWELFCNDWLYTHDGCYYHMSDVEGDKLINQEDEYSGEEAKEYARGLISYIEKYGLNPTIGPKSKQMYEAKLKELKEFVK